MVLSWLLHRQLMDEVDNRVDDAKSGFQSELDDDLTDQSLSLKVMASDEAVIRALENDDAKAARAVAQVFADVYPELDFVIADRDGKVLTELGVTAPPERIDSISELHGVAKGADFHGIIEHGCEKPGSGAPPAIVMAKGFAGKGSIVVCQPINLPYLDDAKKKLSLELALLEPATGKLIVATARFPTALIPQITHESLIADDGATTWAVLKYEPQSLAGPMGAYSIAPALDVTGIKSIVTHNLMYALANPPRDRRRVDCLRDAARRDDVARHPPAAVGAEAAAAAGLHARRGRGARATSSRTSRSASTSWSTAEGGRQR